MESNQTKSLAGQICLVPGSAREIGRIDLGNDGTRRSGGLFLERAQEPVNQAVAELARHGSGKVEGKAADVRDSDQVAEFFRYIDTRFGGLDKWGNKAGVGIFKSVSEISLGQWKATVATNLFGVFDGTREALLRFETRGRGYIVHISSLAGADVFTGGAATMLRNGEAAMQNLRSQNVRVSYVMRGNVEFGRRGRDRKDASFHASENFSEPVGGSTFKTSATGAEEVIGASESAGSGEHLKKWY